MGRKKKFVDEPTVNMSLSMNKEFYEKFKELARKDDRNCAYIMRKLLEGWVKEMTGKTIYSKKLKPE